MLFTALKKVYFANESEREEKAKKCFSEDLPKFLMNAEKMLRANGGEHFAGDKVLQNLARFFIWLNIVLFYFSVELG